MNPENVNPMFITTNLVHWMIQTLILFLTLLYILHKYISRNYDYWEKRGVPYLKPKPFVGNILDLCLMQYNIGSFFAKLYKENNEPFFGIFLFSKPVLCVKDVNLLKHIFSKDFDVFVDKSLLFTENQPITSHLLFLERVEQWRVMRNKLTPFFSQNNVKNMFKSVDKVASIMAEYLKKCGPQDYIEAKDISCKYTVDVMALQVFGITRNSFEKKDWEFLEMMNKLFENRFPAIFAFFCHFFNHPIATIFQLPLFNAESLSYVRKLTWEVIEAREKLDTQRPDIINIITELRKDTEFCEAMKFVGDKIAAQPLTFFAAGYETTAAIISFALYELCIDPEIQKKTRDDIKNTIKRYNGELSFESIQEMSYLNMVIKETLRKYPILPFFSRVTSRRYNIPETNIILEKGTSIVIPLLGLHYDPKYYPEPNEFIPERFEKDIREFFYLPFARGPRACLGERFGWILTRLALVRILNDFELERTEDTPVNLVFDPKSLLLSSTTGLKMKFNRADPLF